MKLEIPKQTTENMFFRAQILEECIKDPQYSLYVRELAFRDILFFFNIFGWAYDPKYKGRERPIITFTYQDSTILKINECIDKEEDLFIDKSREMLATYMILYTYLWRWLSKPMQLFRIGSWKEIYVDQQAVIDTHFEKFRYLLQRLPQFLQPVGFDIKKHNPYMLLKNPENGSTVVGEATNASFARSGRQVSIFLDEFSEWETASEAWNASTDSTKCRIVTGTPRGAANKFAELSRTKVIPNKLRLWWYYSPDKCGTSKQYLEKVKKGEVVDPHRNYIIDIADDQTLAKDAMGKFADWEIKLIKEKGEGLYVDSQGQIRSEWYDRECERRSSQDRAENLDINYISTGNPKFEISICIKNQLACKPPIKRGNLIWEIAPKYDENGYCINKKDLKVKFVPNANGRLKIWEEPIGGWENGYCISADVSEGLTQGDYDSATVRRRFLLQGEEQVRNVATLHGHMREFEYAEELAKLGVYYFKPYIAIERQGHSGGAVITSLYPIYPKLYHKEVMSKGLPESTDKLGFDNTNRTIKTAVIDRLSEAIFNGEFLDEDEDFWGECLTFVNNDGKLEAQGKSKGEKCFDDRVMDRAIGNWIDGQLPRPKRINMIVPQKTWRDVIEVRENSLVSGFVVH